jgi:streptogramin lyase
MRCIPRLSARYRALALAALIATACVATAHATTIDEVAQAGGNRALASGSFLFVTGEGKVRYGVPGFNKLNAVEGLPAGANPKDMISIPLGSSQVVVVSDPDNHNIYVLLNTKGSSVKLVQTFQVPYFNSSSPGNMVYDGQLTISGSDGKLIPYSLSELITGIPKAAPPGLVSVIPTPPGAAGPPSALNLAAGGDGNVWFTETRATDAQGNPIVTAQEKIGRITPAGVITEFTVPTPNAGTGSTDATTGTYITAGADGNVWFTEKVAGKVGRITPSGAIAEFALPGSGTILGLASGPDGNIWVKGYAGKIFRVTPTGTVTSFTIPTTSFGRDVELVPGPDGALWFMEDKALGRITMAGVITEFPLPTPAINGTPNYPFQLAFLSDGTGAFIEFTGNNLAVLNVPTPDTGTVSVVEFYNAGLDHYFLSFNTPEIVDLDTGVHAGWARTGLAFNAYPPAHAGTSPVCRFYIPPQFGDSHFFGRGTAECNATAAAHPAFDYESPEVMDMLLPTSGTCPANTVPVYRVFSNRPDANHRYTVSRTVRDQMVAKHWAAEGDGPDLVVMCSPV